MGSEHATHGAVPRPLPYGLPGSVSIDLDGEL